MTISIIAACSRNRVIGCKGDLPWRMPADLRRFRRLTMGHRLVMGRKTFESLKNPLPGREIVVVTRQKDYTGNGARVISSLDEALQPHPGNGELFIGGGGEIYRQTIRKADRMYLTVVHTKTNGDAFFPSFSEAQWKLLSSKDHTPDSDNPYPFTFLTYERRSRWNG